MKLLLLEQKSEVECCSGWWNKMMSWACTMRQRARVNWACVLWPLPYILANHELVIGSLLVTWRDRKKQLIILRVRHNEWWINPLRAVKWKSKFSKVNLTVYYDYSSHSFQVTNPKWLQKKSVLITDLMVSRSKRWSVVQNTVVHWDFMVLDIYVYNACKCALKTNDAEVIIANIL